MNVKDAPELFTGGSSALSPPSRVLKVEWSSNYVISGFSYWHSNMIFSIFPFLQIDDTDAMEDVHSLLTDVPPPSGMVTMILF